MLMGVFDTFFVFGVSSVDFLFARELGVFILAVPNFGSPLLGVDFTLLTSGVVGFGVTGFNGFTIIGVLVVFWTGVCIFFAFGDTTISFGFLSC
jgi:hypothetical protein